jgi:hypothetical protein
MSFGMSERNTLRQQKNEVVLLKSGLARVILSLSFLTLMKWRLAELFIAQGRTVMKVHLGPRVGFGRLMTKN